MISILSFPYQFLAQNFVVSGLGRIEIPTFEIPTPVNFIEPWELAITVQNHTLDNSFVSMNYTFESIDGSYVYEFPRNTTSPLYGTAQTNFLHLNGSLSYKWTIDYHYNTDKPQIIQIRMYCKDYHDFLPLPDF
ncbi:hypothetical protein GCK72_015683 [Caenorhabditis remanei]|uniref:DUF7154 domain-containing protein n=1 Tax=Caenorhabditis remanei TaxID=31234 RepID=A0A6A5GY29_CAERE|nr:hypothetical protein GCK72_015683 [Caenorhabditis remanei]KAF1759222.1 hypothetical protein GCK72_015683 [Caenorhabditis remanei]